MVSVGQTQGNLEARLTEKPWPKGLLLKPEKWHIWGYLGLGLTTTVTAGALVASGQAPDAYVAPIPIILAVFMYFRAAQFVNYFYGE